MGIVHSTYPPWCICRVYPLLHPTTLGIPASHQQCHTVDQHPVAASTCTVTCSWAQDGNNPWVGETLRKREPESVTDVMRDVRRVRMFPGEN